MKTSLLIAALAIVGIAGPYTADAQVTKTTTVYEGTVTTFEPGASIIVRSAPDADPMEYRLHKDITYVNPAGAPVEVSKIDSGTTVKVEYMEVDGVVYAKRVIVPDIAVSAAAEAGTKTTTTTTTSTTTTGVVRSYAPGSSLIVATDAEGDPITYRVSEKTVFMTPQEKALRVSRIKPGAPVTVYYDTVGDARVVNRVVVDDYEEYVDELEDAAEDAADAREDAADDLDD